jgi:hypothetical protein
MNKLSTMVILDVDRFRLGGGGDAAASIACR